MTELDFMGSSGTSIPRRLRASSMGDIFAIYMPCYRCGARDVFQRRDGMGSGA